MANSKGVLAVGAVMLLAAAHGNSHHHGHGGFASLLSSASRLIPSGGSYTPSSFARAVLRAEGDPRTPANVCAIVSWEAAEGGNLIVLARRPPARQRRSRRLADRRRAWGRTGRRARRCG